MDSWNTGVLDCWIDGLMENWGSALQQSGYPLLQRDLSRLRPFCRALERAEGENSHHGAFVFLRAT